MLVRIRTGQQNLKMMSKLNGIPNTVEVWPMRNSLPLRPRWQRQLRIRWTQCRRCGQKRSRPHLDKLLSCQNISAGCASSTSAAAPPCRSTCEHTPVICISECGIAVFRARVTAWDLVLAHLFTATLLMLKIVCVAQALPNKMQHSFCLGMARSSFHTFGCCHFLVEASVELRGINWVQEAVIR